MVDGAIDRCHLDADPLHGFTRAQRQLADFIGHHRKATSGITGTRRFDRGIECKQLGLSGDFAHLAGHLLQFAGKAGEFMDAGKRRRLGLQCRAQRVDHPLQSAATALQQCLEAMLLQLSGNLLRRRHSAVDMCIQIGKAG